MIKPFFLFITALIASISVMGQNRDSLIRELSLAVSDAEKARLSLSISRTYQRVDSIYFYSSQALELTDSTQEPFRYAQILEELSIVEYRKLNYFKAIEFQHRAMALNRKVGSKVGQAKNVSRIATCYFSMRQLETAKYWQFKAIEFCKNSDDPFLICDAYLGLGNIYNLLEEVDSSITYYSLAVEVAEMSKKKKHIGLAGVALGNLAGLYMKFNKDFTKGIEFAKRAIEIGEILDQKSNIITSLNILGQAYLESGRDDEAIAVFERAIKLNTDVNLNSLTHTYNNLGVVYQKRGNYEKALRYLLLALEKIPDGHRNHLFLMTTIGEIYTSRGDRDSALFCLESTEDLIDKTKVFEETASICFALARTHEKGNNHSRANEYLHKSIVARDSAFVRENAEILQEAYAKYKTRQQKDSTTIARAETQIATKEAIIQKNWKQFYIVAIILLLILLGSLYKNYVTYKADQKIIEQENKRLTMENGAVIENLKTLEGLIQSLEFLNITAILINDQKVLLGDIIYLKAEDKTVKVRKIKQQKESKPACQRMTGPHAPGVHRHRTGHASPA